MVTVSHIVKKMVSERPMLQETMRQGIISYGALAELWKPLVEGEVGRKVKESAIVMALRRHAEELGRKSGRKPASLFQSEILMKSGVVDISVAKSGSLASRLIRLYGIVDFRKGGILNLIHGNFEVSIITNERSLSRVLKLLEGEEIIAREGNLAAISLSISKEHLYAPGTIFSAVRKLAWDNVNIFEIVSTTTELTFIVNQKDAARAYNSLHELVREARRE